MPEKPHSVANNSVAQVKKWKKTKKFALAAYRSMSFNQEAIRTPYERDLFINMY
jgi:hypothetical protein